MTADELVEKVAREMAWMESHAYEYCLTYKWEDYARAAIAVVLEEAAKVADSARIPMCEGSADLIAAAIRAMISKGDST